MEKTKVDFNDLDDDTVHVFSGQDKVKRAIMGDVIETVLHLFVTNYEMPIMSKIVYMYLHVSDRPRMQTNAEAADYLDMGQADFSSGLLRLLELKLVGIRPDATKVEIEAGVGCLVVLENVIGEVL